MTNKKYTLRIYTQETAITQITLSMACDGPSPHHVWANALSGMDTFMKDILIGDYPPCGACRAPITHPGDIGALSVLINEENIKVGVNDYAEAHVALICSYCNHMPTPNLADLIYKTFVKEMSGKIFGEITTSPVDLSSEGNQK